MKLFLTDISDKALDKSRLAAELLFLLLVESQEGQDRDIKGSGSLSVDRVCQLKHGTQFLARLVQRAGPIQGRNLAFLLMAGELALNSLHARDHGTNGGLGLIPVLAVHREVELGSHKREGLSHGKERGSIRRKRKKAGSTGSASKTGKSCDMEEGATGQTFSRVYRVVVHGKRKFFILPQGLKGTLRGGQQPGCNKRKILHKVRRNQK